MRMTPTFAVTTIRTESFGVAKLGAAPSESDDYGEFRHLDERFLVAAIADGASESMFAGQWARALVQQSLASPPWPELCVEWLREARARLPVQVSTRELPWYMEQKIIRGSHATLLIIQVDRELGELKLLGIGDSCALIVIDGKVTCVFPERYGIPTAFQAPPDLIGSNPDQQAKLGDQIQTKIIELPSEGAVDVHLMTDALAEWCIRASQSTNRDMRTFQSKSTATSFERFIGEQRSARQMKNDDATLLSLRMLVQSKRLT